MATGYQGYVGYGDPEKMRVDRARQLAEMLQQGATDTSPKSLPEGIAQLGKAWIASQAGQRADAAEQAYSDNQKKAFNLLTGQMFPDAQQMTQTDLNAPAAFDLTPGGTEQRQAAGAQSSKAGQLARWYVSQGMSPPEAIQAGLGMQRQALEDQRYSEEQAYKRAQENKPAYFSTAQGIAEAGPDGVRMALPIEPEAKPITWQTEHIGDRIIAYNPQDPSQTRDMGAAPPAGGGAGNGLTPYQGLNFQFKLDDLDRELEGNQRKRRDKLSAFDNSIKLIEDFIDPKNADKFNAVFGNWMNPTGEKDDLFNWNTSMDPNRTAGMAILEQIGGKAFLDNISAMAGTGPLSDAEGRKVAAAATRLMNVKQGDADALKAAQEYLATVKSYRAALAQDMADISAAEQTRRERMAMMMGAATGQPPPPRSGIASGNASSGGGGILAALKQAQSGAARPAPPAPRRGGGDVDLSQLTPEQLDALEQQLMQGGGQ